MIYLNKYKNVSSILTTHFVKVCIKLERSKGIQNYKMVTETDENNNKLKYKYKMEKGISQVKGVVNILKEMNYPKEIIGNIE